MISLTSFLEMSLDSPIPPPPGAELDAFSDWLLSTADFLGWQLSVAGPAVQIWVLKKRLASLPAGTPLTRATLAAYHAGTVPAKPGAKYGSGVVDSEDPAIKAVESP